MNTLIITKYVTLPSVIAASTLESAMLDLYNEYERIGKIYRDTSSIVDVSLTVFIFIQLIVTSFLSIAIRYITHKFFIF